MNGVGGFGFYFIDEKHYMDDSVCWRNANMRAMVNRKRSLGVSRRSGWVVILGVVEIECIGGIWGWRFV